MRTFLLLLLATCIHACDSDEVEYYCPETDFSERNSLKDTMFIGTWQWAYTVFTCNQALSHGGSVEIVHDTVWPNEYMPSLGLTYPDRFVFIGSADLAIQTDLNNESYCITEWDSYEYNNTLDIRVKYRKLNESTISEMYFSHTVMFSNPILCRVYPAMHSHDVCPSVYPGYYFPGVQDHYIKVN
jgi:hypothetical protein